MLKTTQKAFVEKLDSFVFEQMKDDDCFIDLINDEKEAYKRLYNYFYSVMIKDNRFNRYGILGFDAFEYFTQGLPCDLFDYYLYKDSYNAIDLLGDMLEQSPIEKEKYSLSQSSKRLTQLIYREMMKKGGCQSC